MSSVRNLKYRVPKPLRSPHVLTGVLIALGLAAMEVAAQFEMVSAIFVSAPTAIFAHLLSQLQTPDVQNHITTTAWRIFLAFAIILLLSAAISFAFWRSSTLRRAYLPILGGLFGTPIILTYLVFVAIFGRGTVALVAVSIPMGTIPIVLNATDALINVDRTFIDVSRVYNASRWQFLTKVLIPAAAPGIFAGVRVGFTYTVISIIAAEFLLVMNVGLGGMISNMYFKFQTTNMFVGIVLIMLLVILSIAVLRRIEEVVQR